MYRVLIPRRNNDGDFVGWICIGTAKDYQEAKRNHGGYSVLEEVKK